MADQLNHTIRKIGLSGAVTTVAGQPGQSGSTDGIGPAARFNNPCGIVADSSGVLFVTDRDNATVRRISNNGVVTTLAGSAGQFGSTNGNGAAARFSSLLGIALLPGMADGSFTLFVSEYSAIRKILPDGTVTTFAGDSGISGSLDGTGSNARFRESKGISIDSSGNLYVVDSGNHTIRRITPSSVVTTLAGMPGVWGTSDGTGIAARFYFPAGITIYGNDLIVCDSLKQTIRRVTLAGVTTTFSGVADMGGSADGSSRTALFSFPQGIAVDTAGNTYVADGNRIRKISPSGSVTTFAGTVASGSANGTATSATFNAPKGVAIDSTGNLYVADTGNNMIRKITPAAVVTTLAGRTTPVGNTDGAGTTALFWSPTGIAVGADGSVYVADLGNASVRKVTSSGVVSTVAGSSGSSGSTDGTGSAARFRQPEGIAVDSAGNLFVADTGNHSIRRITPARVVTTFAGASGITGSVDGIAAVARFNNPVGITVSGTGVIHIVDRENNTIRQISSAGTVTTVGGTPGATGSGEGSGTAASFNYPTGLAASADGTLYVTNSAARNIVKGVQTTYVWSGGGTTNNWSEGANWVGGVAPSNDGTKTIVFGASSRYLSQVDVPWAVNSIVFGSGRTSDYMLQGSALTIGAGGIEAKDTASRAATLGNAIALAASQTWRQFATTNFLRINGMIALGGQTLSVTSEYPGSGGSGVNLAGAVTGIGHLILNPGTNIFVDGSHSYVGTLTCNAGGGNVHVSTPDAFPGVIVNDTNSIIFNVGHNNNRTISGTGSISYDGDQNYTITGSNNYSGRTALGYQGTPHITLASNTPFGSDYVLAWYDGAKISSDSARTFANQLYFGHNVDKAFTFSGNFPLTFSGGAILGTTARAVVTAPSLTIQGVVSTSYGTSDLVKEGSGTLVLSGATSNTYTGNTTIKAGTLSLSKGESIAAIASGLLRVEPGATVSWAGSDQVANGVDVAMTGGELNLGGRSEAMGTLDLDGAAELDFGTVVNSTTAAFSSSSAINWTGGTLTVSGFVPGTTTLRFGSDASSLSVLQLSSIHFTGFSSGARIDNLGYVTPPGFTQSEGVAFSTPASVALVVNGFTATGQTVGAITLGFAPTQGQVLTLVNNTSNNPIVGVLTNLTNGGAIATSYAGRNFLFVANYSGGDGNDLTLTLLNPEIAVEQPLLTNIADGGSHGFGTMILGSPASLVFTIKNTGPGILNGLTINKSGPDLATFTVTASPTAPLAGPAGTTAFTVQFNPATSGAKTAAIHIASDDADENPFDIILSGHALTASADTDTDGLNDVAEYNMAALGFNWQVSQPGLVNSLFTNANGAGLYRTSQVQALKTGTPHIARDPATGRYKLTMDWKKSTDFTTFTDFPAPAGSAVSISPQGDVELEFPSTDNAAFYRIEVD
ncbi:MAG: choice-of-anchor D domain-containing protein [Luteolibacter sp.]